MHAIVIGAEFPRSHLAFGESVEREKNPRFGLTRDILIKSTVLSNYELWTELNRMPTSLRNKTTLHARMRAYRLPAT